MVSVWCMGRGKLATLSPDNAIECVVHGCDVLNKRGFARPYVLSEHTLVLIYLTAKNSGADRNYQNTCPIKGHVPCRNKGSWLYHHNK